MYLMKARLKADFANARLSVADPVDTLDRLLRRAIANTDGEGNFEVEGVRVVDFKVQVMIYLRDLTEATRTALKELGFEQTAESKTTRLLVGTPKRHLRHEVAPPH